MPASPTATPEHIKDVNTRYHDAAADEYDAKWGIDFAGEPSRYGDRLAALPKRTGMLVAPAWRRLVGARVRAVPEAEQSHGHALESEVDVHAFSPADLR